MIRSQHAGITHNGGIGVEVFTEDEKQAIHWGTVEVLETAGLWVEDDEAIDLFADGGCKVDRSTRKVKIPSHVLEECISWAPSTVRICGRTPDRDVVLEGRRVTYTNFAEGVKAVDPWDGTLRPTTKKDVGDLARVVDALDDIDVYTIAVTATDVAPEVAEAHLIEQSLLNTTKPICSLALGHHGAKLHIDAAAAVVGGHDRLAERPMLEFLSCPVSPLKLMGEFTGCIIEAARNHQIAMPLSMAMSGGSAPVTLAGTMVTHNAEVLGGIVLAQLAEKGAKCIYGSSTTAFDLQRAAATVGTPELALISAAVPAMARFYLLPSWVAGLQADSKLGGDVQCALEKSITGLLPALGGANQIYGAGMIESGVTIDYGVLVMDDEIARINKYALRGIPTNDETLMVDEIVAVGSDEDFLSRKSTLKMMRAHQSKAGLIDRRVRDEWDMDGGTDMYYRCTEKAKDLVESHEVPALPSDVVEQIRAIVVKCEKDAGVA